LPSAAWTGKGLRIRAGRSLRRTGSARSYRRRAGFRGQRLDVPMLECLSGTRVGAASYNLFHTYATPGLLDVLDLLTDSYAAVSVALVWFAPIGFDRRVGFGLKYPTGFSTPPTNALTLTLVAVKQQGYREAN
jgi:Domain of unknown function (DUF4260)